jgi:hypothetical protein
MPTPEFTFLYRVRNWPKYNQALVRSSELLSAWRSWKSPGFVDTDLSPIMGWEVSMGARRRKFSREFKLEAVRMVSEGGHSAAGGSGSRRASRHAAPVLSENRIVV